MILYLKNPNEYGDTLSDLFEITKFEEGWTKVYIDLIISMIHQGCSKFQFIFNKI